MLKGWNKRRRARNEVVGLHLPTNTMAPLMVLLAGLLVPTHSQLDSSNAYKITPMGHQPGIYYEHVGPLRIRHADWRVATYMDIHTFTNDFIAVDQRLTFVLKECCSVSRCDRCQEMLRIPYFQRQIKRARELSDELEALASISNASKEQEAPRIHTMTRRSAPLGFVGSLSKSLFGTLNEGDAEDINAEIDHLYDAQANISRILSKEIHIVRSSLQELHEDHREHQRVVDILYRRVDKLQGLLRVVTNETTKIIYHNEIVSYTYRIDSKIIQYIDACKEYLAVIAEAREGRYRPSVLKTEQLRAIFQEIQARAPEFEFPLSFELLRGETLANLARTDIAFQKGRMIIVAHIPLLEHSTYQLYRLHAWPAPQNNQTMANSAYISPTNKYIVLSGNKRSYFMATESYLHTCVTAEQRLICQMENPLVETITSDQCEINMLLRPNAEGYRNCDIRLRRSHQAFWTHLPTQGGWLYSLIRKESIHILCSNGISTSVTLNGAGVLHLSPNCVGHTPSTTLAGTRVYGGNIQYFYTPEVSLNLSLLSSAFPETGEGEAKKTTVEPLSSRISHVRSNYQAADESLLDLEERAVALETLRRQREREHGNITAGFSLHALLGLVLAIYMLRTCLLASIGNLYSRVKRKCRQTKTDVETGPPRPFLGTSTEPARVPTINKTVGGGTEPLDLEATV